MEQTEHYLEMPNKYIFCNLENAFGINHEFLVLYQLLDRNKSFENRTWFRMIDALHFAGSSQKSVSGKHKTVNYENIMHSLQYMVSMSMIEIETEYGKTSLTLYKVLLIKIIPENFYSNDYTPIPYKYIDQLRKSKQTKRRVWLITAYFFLYAYMTQPPRDIKVTHGNKINFNNMGRGFFSADMKSLSQMLGVCSATASELLDTLCNLELLVRKTTGSICIRKKRINLPNIYVIKEGNWQEKIDECLLVVKNKYRAQTVADQTYRYKKNELITYGEVAEEAIELPNIETDIRDLCAADIEALNMRNMRKDAEASGN